MKFSTLFHVLAFQLSLSYKLCIHTTTFAFQITPPFRTNLVPRNGKLQCVKSKFDIQDDMRFSPDISKGPLNLPLLSDIIPMTSSIPPREVTPRNQCGDDENPTEYWFHNKIHTFGNTNILGGLHAAVAPAATWLIDEVAYDGIDVRSKVAQDLYNIANKTKAYILDLCCGVGMSTRCLASSFHDAEYICGIDTSPEMISMARCITKFNSIVAASKRIFLRNSDSRAFSITTFLMNAIKFLSNSLTNSQETCTYAVGNSERINAPKSKFDLVTIFYAFHEIPYSARYRIIRESRRLLKPGGKLAIIDICPTNYVPSPSMLSGEPYVVEYQKNIEKQLERIQGFQSTDKSEIIHGHVVMWVLTRN